MRLGVKAAPDDVDVMSAMPNAEFVETVLHGRDLADEEAIRRTARAYVDHEVVVHVPFTVPDGPEVDVAATDPGLREISYAMWDASVRLADRLDARWVVLHPGGIASPRAASSGDAGPLRADALAATEEALLRLKDEHGRERILIENLPSHYHRASGVTDRCLTGQAPVDLLQWADLVAGFCLDTAHAWLTPGAGRNLDALLGRLGSRIRHLHLSDARAPDHEGQQIGAGDVPWADLAAAIARIEDDHGPLTGVPEVRDGHRDGGAGFRVALDRLRGLLA